MGNSHPLPSGFTLLANSLLAFGFATPAGQLTSDFRLCHPCGSAHFRLCHATGQLTSDFRLCHPCGAAHFRLSALPLCGSTHFRLSALPPLQVSSLLAFGPRHAAGQIATRSGNLRIHHKIGKCCVFIYTPEMGRWFANKKGACRKRGNARRTDNSPSQSDWQVPCLPPDSASSIFHSPAVPPNTAFTGTGNG